MAYLGKAKLSDPLVYLATGGIAQYPPINTPLSDNNIFVKQTVVVRRSNSSTTLNEEARNDVGRSLVSYATT